MGPGLTGLLARAAARLRAAGVDGPRLDAELLLARALGVARLDVLTGSAAARTRATPAALRRFRALLARRARRVPLQYLTGTAEFYGRPFRVTPAVLVPRPETETLVACARDWLDRNRKHETGNQKRIRILDVGTGSGNIAVTIACECPSAEVVATDVSRAALAVARSNARRHGVAGRIRFLAGDLFEALHGGGAFPPPPRLETTVLRRTRRSDTSADAAKAGGPRSSAHRDRGPKAAPTTAAPAPAFDLILCNPPYIALPDLARCQPEVRDHEPRRATAAGRDGLSVIRRLAVEAPEFLAPGGSFILEVGAGQAGRIAGLLEASGGYDDVRVVKDLAGIRRVVLGRGKPQGIACRRNRARYNKK